MSQKRYLFLLRAYNDIDNIVPVIYFLLERRTDAVVTIVLYRGYEPANDENLAFLKRTFRGRVAIISLYDRLNTFLHKKHGKKARKPILWRFLTDDDRYSDEERAEVIGMIVREGPPPRLAVFDQVRSTEIIGIARPLREHGIPLVALPVSPLTNVNTMRLDRFVDRELKADAESRGVEYMHDYHVFDRIVFTDDVYLTYLDRYYRSCGKRYPLMDRCETLGSVRFCPEWLTLRNELSAPYFNSRGGLKLAFFLSQPKNNAFWDELLRTIHFLSHYPECTLVIKPHTRNMEFNLPADAAAENIIIEENISSPALIDWADAVLVWGSSIAIDAFIKKKIVLYLRYLHANLSMFELFNAGWQIRCRDELKFAIEALIKDPTHMPYRQENVRQLLRKIVDADREGAVPDRYLDFLSRCEQAREPTGVPG